MQILYCELYNVYKVTVEYSFVIPPAMQTTGI